MNTRLLESSIPSPLGGALFYQWFRFQEEAKGTLLFVHGLAEHIGRYSHIFKEFNQRGYDVLAYDHRGHGRSSGERGHINDFKDYVIDLKTVVQFAKTLKPPLFILAHSLGCLISFLYMIEEDHQKQFQAGAFIGFPLKPLLPASPLKKVLALKFGKLIPKMNFGTDINPHFLSRNERIREKYLEDPLILKKVTAGWYLAYLEALEKFPKDLGELLLPALFLHGGDDQITHPDGSRVVFQNYSDTQKQLHIYEGCFHELLNETCYGSICKEIDLWFEPFSKKDHELKKHQEIMRECP